MRQHQLAEAIGFFKMRVTREDEGIDAEPPVFVDALGDRGGIADQRRAGAAAHQADAGP